jgi:hypothetical protein
LLNNTVGRFEESPSVDARMRSFNDSIEKMLWPERRDRDDVLGAKIPGRIDRTTTRSFLHLASGFLPDPFQRLRSPSQRLLPWIFGDDGVQIGPIPANTPVGLLTNLNPLSEDRDPAKRLERAGRLVDLLIRMKLDLLKLPSNATDDQARQVLMNLVDPMLELSKCPDLIVNRGHYFGTGYVEPGASDPVQEAALSDQDKRALIEFVKTF